MTATTIEALGEDAEGMVGVRFPELAKFGDAAVEASEKVLA